MTGSSEQNATFETELFMATDGGSDSAASFQLYPTEVKQPGSQNPFQLFWKSGIKRSNMMVSYYLDSKKVGSS